MRKLNQIILLAALVTSTSAALAQERGARGFGRGAGAPSGAMLLGQKSVQEDLKLSEEQIKQVNEFSAKQRASFSGLRDASREERVKAFADSREAGQKALDTILNDEQRVRLKQITLQLAGPAAFHDPQVAEKLALTDEQKKSIEEIQSSHRDEMRSLFQDADGDRAAAFRKMQAARQATEDKLKGLLTDEQKTKLQELTGKKFEGRLEGPGSRGPGRGRRDGQDARLRREAPAAERDTTVLTADKSEDSSAEQRGKADKKKHAKRDGDRKQADHKRGDKKKSHAKHAKHRKHGEHAARHHGRKSHARHASHGKRQHHGHCHRGYAHHGHERGHGRPSGYAWHPRHRFGGPSHRGHFAHRGHFGPHHHFAGRRHFGPPHPFGHDFDARRQAWDRVARAMGEHRGHHGLRFDRHHSDRHFAHRHHGHPGHRGPHHFAHGSWRGAGQKFHVWSDRGRHHGEHHQHHDRRLSDFDGPRGPNFAWHFDRHREDGPGFDREHGNRPPRMHPAGFKKRPHDAGKAERSKRDGDQQKLDRKRDRDLKAHEKHRDCERKSGKRDVDQKDTDDKTSPERKPE